MPCWICVHSLRQAATRCVHGLSRQAAKPRNVPVFCNTGCRHENVREKLKYCDAVCMGTAFKKDGVFNGRVDEERVRSFMEIVYDIRARL